MTEESVIERLKNKIELRRRAAMVRPPAHELLAVIDELSREKLCLILDY